MVLFKKNKLATIDDQIALGQPWTKVYAISIEDESEIVFAGSLCIYLVFDLSGAIELEPFLIDCLDQPTHLILPRSSHLALISFQFENIRNILPDLNSNQLLLNSQWVYWLYYSLLDLKNENQFSLQNFSNLSTQFANYGSVVETAKKIDASKSGFSPRHERRIFKLNFGVSPSRQINVKKFVNSLSNFYTTGQIDYGKYYDQAHFIKSVKKYTGLTPKTIIQEYLIL